MKNILEKLKKFNTPLYYGILCAVFGVSFIILPYLWKPALDILLIIGGVFSIFVGILTISLLDTESRDIGYYLSVIRTLCFIGFGVFLITSRSALAGTLCTGYGIYLLYRSIPGLIKCITLPKTDDKTWWLRLILSIFEIILGIWLILYPMWPYVLAGASLILTAIELFVKHKKSPTDYIKGTPRVMFGTVFDPEFEDKSDE